MGNKPKRFRVICGALVIAALIFLGDWLQTHLQRLAAAHGLRQRLAPDERMPPGIAMTTIALGGFRGLIADALFLRLIALQQQGNYYEMTQLASWITRVQPEFTGASTFLAWNMAYNLSNACNRPEDRWRWVLNGIQLLRDQALLHDPDNPVLYRELSWLYLHKIGEDWDRSNQYYKARLAGDMTKILGAEFSGNWHDLAQAAANRDELARQLGPDYDLLSAELKKQKLTFSDLERTFRTSGHMESVSAITFTRSESREKLLHHLRRWALMSEWNLDPALIMAVNSTYGEMDFRLSAAHALYWAQQGKSVAPGGHDKGCEHLIFAALKQAFFSGKLRIVPGTSMVFTAPNIGLADAVRTAYLEAIAHRDDPEVVVDGYENFMIQAIGILYTFNQRETAENYLSFMRDSPWFANHPRYHQSLDDFVLDQLIGDQRQLTSARLAAIVSHLLDNACGALLFADHERAAILEQLARRVYRETLEMISTKDIPNQPPVPGFDHLREQAWQRFTQELPEELRHHVLLQR